MGPLRVPLQVLFLEVVPFRGSRRALEGARTSGLPEGYCKGGSFSALGKDTMRGYQVPCVCHVQIGIVPLQRYYKGASSRDR